MLIWAVAVESYNDHHSASQFLKKSFFGYPDEKQDAGSLGEPEYEVEHKPTKPEGLNKEPQDAHKNTSTAGAETRQYKAPKRYQTAANKEDGPKYPIIASIGQRLEKVFGKYSDVWWEDWKLWVGAVLWFGVWATWIICGYREVYYEQSVFVFAINLMILHHLQYTSDSRMGVYHVIAALGLQNLFSNTIWFKPHEAKEGETEEPFECDTLYLDIGLGFEQILVLFIAQVCIWWFYMTSIINQFRVERLDSVSYAFWLVAYLSMQITMIFNRGEDSVLGNPFPVNDVYRLVRHAGVGTFRLMGEEDAVPFKISRIDTIARGVMGYWCNSILREIMSYTIPLMLMDFTEPMDFVVYCVGVNFICTLDDMTPKKYSMRIGDEAHPEQTPRDEEKRKPLVKRITGLK